MSVTSGFFNSSNGDRLYDAEQMSMIFDGVISDGIFKDYLSGMAVSPGGGMTVYVEPGRCWFDHTWVYVSDNYSITIPAANCKYYVVVDIDHNDSVRAGSIKLLRGDASQYPSYTRENKHNQYVIASINVPSGATAIQSSMLSDTRSDGTLCGYVTGLLHSTDADAAAARAQQYAEAAQLYQEIAQDWNENVAARIEAQAEELNDAVEEMHSYTEGITSDFNDKISLIEENVQTLAEASGEYVTRQEIDDKEEETSVWTSSALTISETEIKGEVAGSYQKKLKDSDGNVISSNGAAFDSWTKQTATGAVAQALGTYGTLVDDEVGTGQHYELIDNLSTLEVTVDGITEEIETKTDKTYTETEIKKVAGAVYQSLSGGTSSTYPLDGTDAQKNAYFTNVVNTYSTGQQSAIQAWALSDEYTVGGPNLLQDSDANTLSAVYANADRGIYATDGATATFTGLARDLCGTDYAVKLSTTTDKAFYYTFYGGTSSRTDASKMIGFNPGDTYTFSCYARASVANKYSLSVRFGLGNANATVAQDYAVAYGSDTDALGTDWQKFSVTLTLDITDKTAGTHYFTTGAGDYLAYFGRACFVATTNTSVTASDYWVEFTGFKMEKGKKATDWRPAISDTTSKAVVEAGHYTDDSATQVIDELWGNGTYSGGTNDLKYNLENNITRTQAETVEMIKATAGSNMLLDSNVWSWYSAGISNSITKFAADNYRYLSTVGATSSTYCQFIACPQSIAGTDYLCRLSHQTAASAQSYGIAWYSGAGVPVIPGKIYTISAYFRSTDPSTCIPWFELGVGSGGYVSTSNGATISKTYIYKYPYDGSTKISGNQSSADFGMTSANTWYKCVCTIQMPPAGTTNVFYEVAKGSDTQYTTIVRIGASWKANSTGTMDVTGFMMQEGTVATAWSDSTLYTNTTTKTANGEKKILQALVGDTAYTSYVEQTPVTLSLSAENITLSGKVYYGSTGVGAGDIVSNTVSKYALSSSKTTAPDSGWSTTYPTPTSTYPYVWIQTTQTYANGETDVITSVQSDITVATSAASAAAEAKTLAALGYNYLTYYGVASAANTSFKIAKINVQAASYVSTPITIIINARRGRLIFEIKFSSNSGDTTTTPAVDYFYMSNQQDSYFNKNNNPTASNYSSFKIFPYLIQNSGYYDIWLYASESNERYYIESIDGCNLTNASGSAIRSGLKEVHTVTLYTQGTTVSGLQSGTRHFPIRFKDDCRSLYTAGTTTIEGGLITTNSIAATCLSINDYATPTGSGSNPTLSGWSMNSNCIYTTGTDYTVFLQKYGSSTYADGQTGVNRPAIGVNNSKGTSASPHEYYPFYVTYAGKLVATNAEIAGTVTATSLTTKANAAVNITNSSGTQIGYVGYSATSYNGTSYTNSPGVILSYATSTTWASSGHILIGPNSIVINAASNSGTATPLYTFASKLSLNSSGNAELSSTSGNTTMRAYAAGKSVYFRVVAGNNVYFGAETSAGSGTFSGSGKVYLISESSTSDCLQIGTSGRKAAGYFHTLTKDDAAVSTSDRRLKKNIVYSVPDIIDDLRPCSFNYNEDAEDAVPRYGFIAQDVLQCDQNLVEAIDDSGPDQDPDEPLYLGLKYESIIPLLVDKCQKLQQQIDSLTQLIGGDS